MLVYTYTEFNKPKFECFVKEYKRNKREYAF